jgi:hypothetical protein
MSDPNQVNRYLMNLCVDCADDPTHACANPECDGCGGKNECAELPADAIVIGRCASCAQWSNSEDGWCEEGGEDTESSYGCVDFSRLKVVSDA